MATSDFELRFDLAGRAAVRVSGGPVGRRHVEPVPPVAPWVAEARCGDAAGWLLAHDAPEDPEAARALLAHTVEREAALRGQALRRDVSALTTDLLERLTHRLRTDVTTLQAVADGALAGLFEAEDLEQLPGELQRTSREALERLTAAREVMRAHDPGARREPESIVETLRVELEAAGRPATVDGPSDEHPLTLVPGPGWAACARALAADARLQMFAVGPDPAGWSVTAGTPGAPVEWTERTVGELVYVGHILAAAGGSAAVTQPSWGQVDPSRCTTIRLIGTPERSAFAPLGFPLEARDVRARCTRRLGGRPPDGGPGPAHALSQPARDRRRRVRARRRGRAGLRARTPPARRRARRRPRGLAHRRLRALPAAAGRARRTSTSSSTPASTSSAWRNARSRSAPRAWSPRAIPPRTC